ncbi:MAG TPA: polyprenyl diphosphate synthase [Gammaproteobacteria bacterium]|nr:polyprenyl diphosphate synthase [Gammaproteobacteria bacterium]
MSNTAEGTSGSLNLPRHVAVIMDGNGRWARKRFLPRVAGHKAGVDSVRAVIKRAMERRVEILTLFAFSSENWRRPPFEVNFLLDLFLSMLQNDIEKLHEQGIKLRVIGDRFHFEEKLQKQIAQAEALTANNQKFTLVIAANYGGQWDLTQAMKRIGSEIEKGSISSKEISAELITRNLAIGDLPAPDLFIRTSGEQRISNFLLWELAYAELYFTDVLWPDFNEDEFDKALAFYAQRERRFGCTSEQLRSELLCLNSA